MVYPAGALECGVVELVPFSATGMVEEQYRQDRAFPIWQAVLAPLFLRTRVHSNACKWLAETTRKTGARSRRSAIYFPQVGWRRDHGFQARDCERPRGQSSLERGRSIGVCLGHLALRSP